MHAEKALEDLLGSQSEFSNSEAGPDGVGDAPLPATGTPPRIYANIGRARHGADHATIEQTPLPTQYPRLIEQVVRSAQRAGLRHDAPGGTDRFGVADASPSPDLFNDTFDHTATFGDRDANEFAHDRRIGAAGEAFVRHRISIPPTSCLPYRFLSFSLRSRSPISPAQTGRAPSVANLLTLPITRICRIRSAVKLLTLSTRIAMACSHSTSVPTVQADFQNRYYLTMTISPNQLSITWR